MLKFFYTGLHSVLIIKDVAARVSGLAKMVHKDSINIQDPELLIR